MLPSTLPVAARARVAGALRRPGGVGGHQPQVDHADPLDAKALEPQSQPGPDRVDFEDGDVALGHWSCISGLTSAGFVFPSGTTSPRSLQNFLRSSTAIRFFSAFAASSMASAASTSGMSLMNSAASILS